MLKDIVSNQKLQKERLLTLSYIGRAKEPFAKKWLDLNLIKIILGPRRAGKSVFSLMLLKDRPFMYFNFDDEVLSSAGGIATDELMKELHAAYGQVKTVLFDEIQNLAGWELFVNRLHREGYNLVLTGSNAHLLSKELATHLTGRHVPIEILPFDFSEFLRAKKFQIDAEYSALPQQRGELLNLMENYLVNGGFPEVAVSNVDPKDYLEVLFDALVFKDVVKRHRVKFSTQVANLGGHLINNFATLYTIRKILEILNLKSASTIEKYIKYLEEAYLIFSLLRYSPKSIQRIKSPRKVYAVDNGFITAKAIQHSSDKGKLMENLVFTELVKRGVKPNRDLFYYKTRNDREIDFVVKNGIDVTELIQVCYESINSDVEQREVKALIEAGGELKVKKLTVLTWDEKRAVEKDGMTIHFRPLWEWLLGDTKTV
ncbi:MAG: ATPase [Candidatus Harrisonbacteria bacterium CG10_big_fil_rev_8_21_14_0_10_45_28]|uniref:ATPase n=1 Tax=Candidatus Harrisonbacteria bacterium CG10_big_fil_rev_8_21_14_0_10_45_28 TaxID=1974586 RepID=A0A2H0UN48_9BACT|nr:MAG: ATPase [Candidatus Harrisonbacteria bacterium CG10_big_fil_rev_8_21_14_0_10_45_28]